MGYTHYYYIKPTLDKKKFKAFAKDVQKLIENADVPLAFECDQTDKKPQIDNEIVRFNGHGNDGHETFMLTRKTKVIRGLDVKGMAFNFCKTACKPYDKYVTACLVLANWHFDKDIKVSSDGDIADWQEGIELAEKIVGEKINFQLD